MAREMRNSGIEWIGEIPVGWGVAKIKSISTSVDNGVWGEDPVPGKETYKVLRSTEQTIDGQWNITAPAERDLSSVSSLSKYVVQKDDLLITKSSGSDEHIGKTTLVTSEISAQGYFYSNFLGRIRVSERYSSKLLWYLLNSNVARSQFVYLQNSTSGLGNINSDMINNLWLPMMSINEQHRIVSFLDTKCAEIDKAIEATKSSIDEYRKLRQAIITEAVTKGLDPNVDMKDSGVEWITVIPAQWELIPLKNMFSIGKGLSITKDNLEEKGIPTISYGQIHAKYNTGTSLDGKMFRFVNDSYLKSNPNALVSKGCFVFADTSEDLDGCGNCIYADNDGEFFAGYHTVTLFPKNGKDNKFFAYLFKTDEWRSQIRAGLTEVKVYSVSQKILRRTSIIIPPKEEQQRIASFLDTKCSEIDSLIKSKEKLIEELTAYRKSLIYEYVTGKKEVPSV